MAAMPEFAASRRAHFEKISPLKEFSQKRNRSLDYNVRFIASPSCKRLQGAADVRRTDTQTYSLYFKCPTTKQMRCPVNAYKKLKVCSSQVYQARER